MHFKSLRVLGVGILCLTLFSLVSADTFDEIKAKIKGSECVHIQFVSIVASSIFESVDSANGDATFERSGKYRINLRKDSYLFDGVDLYSFSYDNQQVSVEKVDSGSQFGAEVSFVTRLDEIYKTRILRPDSLYRLVKFARGYAGVPDSMIVTIDKRNRRIGKIEYFDVNDEPTTIVFQSEQTSSKCDPAEFRPNFPDSVKVVRLP
jgi:outer membrane lipoprotein-sorting protein